MQRHPCVDLGGSYETRLGVFFLHISCLIVLLQERVAACFRSIVCGSAAFDRKHGRSERVTLRIWLRHLHLPVQLGNAGLSSDQSWLCQKKVRRQGNVNVEKPAWQPHITSLAYASLFKSLFCFAVSHNVQ